MLTCCKQHAATAAAAKPKPAPKPVTRPVVPARPAGFRTTTVTTKPANVAKAPTVKDIAKILKSALPKSKSAGELQQEQVTPVVSTGNGPTDSFNQLKQDAGGGGCQQDNVKYKLHDGTMRDERGWPQQGLNAAFSGTFKIPNVKDQLTIEFAGRDHTGDLSNRDGYKVKFDEGGGGVYLQKQQKKDYGPKFKGSNFNVKPGQVYNITVTKQNIGNTGVYMTASVDGQPVGQWTDTVDKPLRPGIAPYSDITNSRFGYRQDGLSGDSGPSVLCGHTMTATPLQPKA